MGENFVEKNIPLEVTLHTKRYKNGPVVQGPFFLVFAKTGYINSGMEVNERAYLHNSLMMEF